jgi:putative ABC transport system ATP-binding protein
MNDTHPTRDRRTTPTMDSTTTPAIEFVDVVKRFGAGAAEVRALRGVSMEVAPGELVAVMGPSGCGKSTLLHVAGGLEQVDAGRVRLYGRDLGDLGATDRAALRRREVSFVFQRLNLLASLTALENVSLPLELDGVGAREARDRAREALAAVGLDGESIGRLDRYPDEFSGGQQQRIAIARALVNKPLIILADEPTGNLDLKTGEEIIDLLSAMKKDLGITIITATHDMKMLSRSDFVVRIDSGAIESVTSKDRLKITVGAIDGKTV